MKNRWTGWLIALLITALLTAAVIIYPCWPGDVAITNFLQAIVPTSNAWADALTTTAKTPWNYVLLAGATLFAWLLAGWRAAVGAIICFLVLLLLGPWLQTVIARPRPSPALVRVVGASSGYSFPSILTLTYAATIGYMTILAWRTLAGRARWVIAIVGALLLLLGGSARIVLGAHWPSDVLTSYLLGLVWAALLISLARARRPSL